VHARRLLQLHAPAAHLQVRGRARPAPGSAACLLTDSPHTRPRLHRRIRCPGIGKTSTAVMCALAARGAHVRSGWTAARWAGMRGGRLAAAVWRRVAAGLACACCCPYALCLSLAIAFSLVCSESCRRCGGHCATKRPPAHAGTSASASSAATRSAATTTTTTAATGAAATARARRATAATAAAGALP